MKLLIFMFLTSLAHAQGWKRAKEDFSFLNEKIIYSNRAFCAKRANLPTRSVFLIVDNVNIAKAAYRLARMKGLNPIQTTDLATDKFRYTVTKLISIISDKLAGGKLPLLETSEVDHKFLAAKWSQSGKIQSGQTINCRIIKKWGSLHSYLRVSRPDHFLLEEIAKDLEKIDETYSSCGDFSDRTSGEVDLYQFDVSDLKDFDKSGFKFWHSLKVYLSWAFRHANEMKELAAPFDYLFRSSDLEEMVLFISASCESMTRPECSEGELNLQSLGELAAPAEKFDFFSSESNRAIRHSPVDHFFSRPLPLKEDDFLQLTAFPNTEDWANNFRNNFLKSRGHQKIRLSSSLLNLNVLQSALTPVNLSERVLAETSNGVSTEWKNDFYHLCAEYELAANAHFSHLRKDLERLVQSKVIADVSKDLALNDIDGAKILYEKLSPEILGICKDLEHKNFWDHTEVDKNGFAPWYLQTTRDGALHYSLKPRLSSVSEKISFLKLNGKDVFCKSGVHCARILLDSLFTLSSVSQSLNTIVPHEITSANLGNPYASHLACGAYDPWSKRYKFIYELFHDLAQAAVFGFLPSPVYVSADISGKELISFNELLKEGKVFYEPQYDSRKLRLSLISDFGPLLGVPCALSISGAPINPMQYYTFSGISFTGCHQRGQSTITVAGDDHLRPSTSQRQFCGSCAINLRTVSSSLSFINPVFRFSSFLLKAILRLSKNLQDPNDIPKSWQVSPHQVALSYRYWGEISKGCARKLFKGRSCLPQECQRRMMETFTRRYAISPVSTSFNCSLNKGEVYVKECDSPVELTSTDSGLEVSTTCILKRRSL